MRKPMICTMLVDKKIGDFARTCSDAQLKVVGQDGIEHGVLYNNEDPFWIRIGPITWSRGQYTHSELAQIPSRLFLYGLQDKP